jgi:hypothetical protein
MRVGQPERDSKSTIVASAESKIEFRAAIRVPIDVVQRARHDVFWARVSDRRS